MKSLFQKLDFFKKISDMQIKRKQENEDKEFFDDITEVQHRLDSVKSRYDLASDTDLVDSLIYEEKALLSRYEYLIKTAKDKGIKSNLKTNI